MSMTYTLSFSHIVDGKRLPLTLDGREVTKQVEADSKSGAVYDPTIKQFCQDNGCTVRRVMP